MVMHNHMKVKNNSNLWLYLTIWSAIMENSVNRAVALRVAELLEQKGMTRYRLAMKSGITHSTLKNIMHETIKDSLLSTVILIAGGFDMSVSEFLDSSLFDEENLNI